MKSKEFVHLHVHSEYSLLDGANKVENLTRIVAKDKQKALAITDHGNMYGALDFYNSCKSNNVKPIIGCEVYIARISRRRKHTKLNGYNHLTLLAKNEEGLRNLFYLSSMSFIEGLSVRPRIDAELLYNNSSGIICLSGCLSGLINGYLRADDYDGARTQLGVFRDIFGEDNTYVEIQRNGIDIQEKCNEGLIKLSKDLNVPLVATNDIHFSRRESCDFHDTLLCVSMGAKKADENRFRFDTNDVFIKSQAEMAHTFRDLPDSVSETIAIEEKINVSIKQGTPIFPVCETEEISPDKFLERLVGNGIRERFRDVSESKEREVEERAKYELDVIKEMGFAEYFIAVKDYIDYAKSVNIPCGPGRGSAAGSLISYCLGLTKVDPLKHGLIFERFINPARKDFPDIDTDFCKERREEVVEYLERKHGADKVARILTVGRFGAKSALRRACSVFDLPLKDSDVIAKRLSDDSSIEESIKSDDLLAKDAQENKEIFSAAIELQQFVSSVGVHASGLIVSNDSLAKIVPLSKSKDGVITTQWDGHACEKIGLIKFDLLGLQTLTTISNCLNLIKERHGKDINLEEIDYEDPNLFKLYQKGDTEGIFQCYSDGMQDLMLKIKPTHFDHIAAALALYRPGPIESGVTSSFCKRKAGQEEILYIHKDAEDCLKETFGLMVYQEQIMDLSRVLAGFTMAEADDLRKAIGKKNQEKLDKIGTKFLEGARETEKISTEDGMLLWEAIKKSGRYSFNKSHSVSYAYISMWTAYLKAYYPVEFYCANMTIEGTAGDLDKLRSFIYDARSHGIEIAPPDLRDCSWDFKIESDTLIRVGLSGIKGVGREAAAAFEERKLDKSKEYHLVDLFKDFDGKVARKNILEPLIKAGALDFLNEDRGVIYSTVPEIIKQLAKYRKRHTLKKGFQLKDIDFDQDTAWKKEELQLNERNVYGFYLTGHPLKDKRLQVVFGRTMSIKEADSLHYRKNDVDLIGVIVSIEVNAVKQGKNKGKKYAKLLLEDEFTSIPVVVFPAMYSGVADELREIYEQGTAVVMTGGVDVSGKKNQLALTSFCSMSGNIDISNGLLVPLSRYTNENFTKSVLEEAEKHPGEIPLKFKVVPRIGKPMIVTSNLSVNLSTKFQEFLFNIL